MTLELKPLGNYCNLDCTYCYQEPMRNAGNISVTKKYDLDLMLDLALKSNKGKPVVFGGESLLVPIKDLEKIFKFGFDHYGSSSIQTNGSLITDKHVELFKKYNVDVGVSIDGPNELNELRKSKQKNKSTETLTEQSILNIRKLVQANIKVGIIITIHRSNGTKEKLPRVMNFIRWLGDMGIKHGNIHMLEIDSELVRDEHSLSTNENVEAFLELARFFDKEENSDLKYSPFKDIKSMQRGDDSQTNCVWKSCDSMNTQAVYGIEGNGSISNCGMVNKEGIEWNKAKDQNLSRDVLLYNTPQEFNGCKGCKYFLMCNGYCPGSSINGDWRNKTVHCKTIKSLFNYYENKLEEKGEIPFSKLEYREELEIMYIKKIIQEKYRYGLSYLIEEYLKNKNC